MSQPKDNASRTISMVMVVTLLGKVLGLLRDRLLAVSYGTGMEASAFLTASRIPRVFFDAVFASAVSACFIPVFTEYLEKKGKKEAFSFANSFASILFLITLVLCALGMVFTDSLVTLFASGYDAETAAMTAAMTRMLFPTVIFTGLAFTFVGILQALGNFHIPALISTASNLVVIGYFLFFDQSFGVWGLTVAFLIGWFLQAAIQIPSLYRLGYRLRPQGQWGSEGMKKVLMLMLPVMVSTWVQPINLTINSHFASYLYDGSGVSAIEYSTNLYLIIAGVFVLSVTNVIFPKLSQLTAQGDEAAFQDTLRSTLQSTLFLVLPMGAGLMIVAQPLISFIYGGGAFDDFSVAITSEALFWLSLGIVGYGVQNILSRAYFARQQGKIPLIAGFVSILVNLLLCAWLTDPLGIAGLAISSALSSTLYGLLLLIPLECSDHRICNGTFLSAFGRMVLATLVMAVTAWGTQQMTSNLVAGKVGEVLSLGATAAVGGLVYLIAAIVLKLPEGQLVCSTVKRLVKRG